MIRTTASRTAKLSPGHFPGTKAWGIFILLSQVKNKNNLIYPGTVTVIQNNIENTLLKLFLSEPSTATRANL